MAQLVIGTGQSNAMGGRHATGGDMTINNRVFVWVDDGWVVAEPSKPPFNVHDPAYNNTMWNACKQLQEDTNEDVYFILSGKGGQPISEWTEGGAQWSALDKAATDAMASPELLGKAVADYFFWYQGESDSGNEAYADDFMDMRSRMVSKGWIEDDTITVVGEVKDNREAKERMLDLIASGDVPWLHMAYNDDLEYNGPHPTGESCVEMGKRFFAASQETSNKLAAKFDFDHFEFGTDFSDHLYTDDNNTLMLGGDGDDWLLVTGEGSMIKSGPGDDVMSISDFGAMTVRGGTGEDTVHLYLERGQDYSMVDTRGVERVRLHYIEPPPEPLTIDT